MFMVGSAALVLEDHGFRSLFLPAQSADLNSIEMAFPKWTAHLRRIGTRNFDCPSPGSRKSAASFRQVNAETTSAAGQTSHAVAALVDRALPTRAWRLRSCLAVTLAPRRQIPGKSHLDVRWNQSRSLPILCATLGTLFLANGRFLRGNWSHPCRSEIRISQMSRKCLRPPASAPFFAHSKPCFERSLEGACPTVNAVETTRQSKSRELS